MAKKAKFNYKQFFIVGLIWSAFYIGVFIRILGVLLEFDFLSFSDYANKFTLFKLGKYNIADWESFRLFLAIILWVPIWLTSWWFLNKVNWNKFKPKPKKSAVKKKVFELKENKPIYQMPRKMPSVVQATRYVAPKLPSQAEVVASGAKSHTNLVQMIRAIAGLAKKYQVEIFQHILLEGNRVPMAISTDARAVLIEIVNKKNVNWSVEFTDDVTAGGWYSESGVMERLAQDLMGASAALARSEPNSEILSAIVITDGRILNTKQAVDYFRSKGIFLIGFNNAEPKNELPDLASFLSAYFDLKPGEQDPAPHPVEKVPIKSKTTQAPIETEVKSDVVAENNISNNVADTDDNDTDTDVDVDVDVDVDDDNVDVDVGISEDDDEVFEFENDEDNQDSDLNESEQFENKTFVSEEEQKMLRMQQKAEEQARSIAKLRAEAEARLQAKVAAQQKAEEINRQQHINQSSNIQSGSFGESQSHKNISPEQAIPQAGVKIRAPMPIKKPTEE